MIRNLAAGQSGFTSNAFLVDGDRTLLVDTGANFDVVSAIRDEVEDLDAVILTHTHPDHVGNVDDVKTAFGVETWGFDADQPAVDDEIDDGERVLMGDHEYVAVHTPGHKNDHLCFYAPETGVLFAGDLVFANGGFGRTDLEEGNRARLVESIEELLETVDSVSELHTGHGPSVTANPKHDVELALQAARMGH